MAREGWYSNRSSGGRSIVRTEQRLSKPHVAGGFQTTLTAKERLARQLTKQGSMGGGGIGGGMGGGYGGGYGGGNTGAMGNTMLSEQGNFFSPQLSTDFLELPQSLRERREIYRHYYNCDELVGQAIDLHTELPLSKVRLAPPKPRTCPKGFKDPHDYGQYILSRFERMCQKVKLFQRLITMVHHYWLDGTCITADGPVTVDGGIKKACDVVVGDLVLTHKGRWRPVTSTIELDAKKILSIDVARLPNRFRVTPDHPIEVLSDDGPRFVPAAELAKGAFVRITWPVETIDVETVSLFDDATPKYVERLNNGYLVRRIQTRSRVDAACRARTHLLDWLGKLDAPCLRSRADIAEEIGVPQFTLHNVITQLQKELPFSIKVRVPSGVKNGPHTLWLPLPPCEVVSAQRYDIHRDWYFESPTALSVSDDLLYVVGYWLGDGTLVRDGGRDTEWGRGLWSIFGHDCSLTYLAKVEAALVTILGRECIARDLTILDDGTRCHTIRVTGSPLFIEWWSKTFGGTSHGDNPKKVPRWVLNLPESKQLAFLGGLIDSDGCVTRTHVGGVVIGLTSVNIVSAARDVMLRLGAVPALNVNNNVDMEFWVKGRRCVKRYPFYSLRVCVEEEARHLASQSLKRHRLDEAPRFFESANSYKRVGDNVYCLVRDVVEEPGEKVYNFQVAEDATFRAHFVSNHNCAIFAEDSAVETPMDVGHNHRVERRSEITDDGEAKEFDEEVWTPKDDAETEELTHYQKNYEGWQRIIILPIDKVKITTFSFTDKVKIELIPSDRDRALLDRARQGDPIAQEMAEEIPAEVRAFMEDGRLIPLGTDPDEGSFVHLLMGRKNADSEVGQSILDRCLRTLNYREKLRQAQTQIASRAMTPKRIVWAEGLSDADTEALRQQVDLALVDPDYSIVANYEIRWEEMGSRDRLLDLSVEYEQTERRLLAGLGVTESLMSGESLYSGDRLKLEVINTRYLHLREILQDYVEESLFKPVARRMGFVEKDQWGQEVVLFPRLSFTRLPLRDSQDTFDALFNLYQKGSVSVDLILEMLNIDPDETKEKLERDLFTVNDAMFNEIIRSVGNEVGRMLAEKTNVTERVAEYLKLTVKPEPKEGEEEGGGGGRFG